jgi:hypothetical protein
MMARDVALRATRLCNGECHRDSSRAIDCCARSVVKAETRWSIVSIGVAEQREAPQDVAGIKLRTKRSQWGLARNLY